MEEGKGLPDAELLVSLLVSPEEPPLMSELTNAWTMPNGFSTPGVPPIPTGMMTVTPKLLPNQFRGSQPVDKVAQKISAMVAQVVIVLFF